ncbi:hypothetical protein B0H15DRAFT_945494 [Mycena belliarum]|uniref:Uncharacterized protein n=1 Tax=Mycena belliarum TaxID=1033014 RepID=A0AAD6XYV3_9AGAR|nr:hypothetical protein B0H15DRAFT_945494 [Mycena belliae]
MIWLRSATAAKSNDASVDNFVHPPPYVPGPYALTAPPTALPFTPSLSWFCLTKLALYPDQIALDVRLNRRAPVSNASYDILRALIPSLSLPEFDWANVDPRVWATVVQIYDALPAVFQCYPIPLADEHLPLLQDVKSTPQFSLVTILELPGCPELIDATIVNLKHLHTLCAFDASATSLSAYGIKILSGTVSWSDNTRRGPWGLRILRLRNCRNIDNDISSHLHPFHLLSMLDLRGTKCRPGTFPPAFQPAPPTLQHLYHPTPLRLSVSLLPSEAPLFSSMSVFSLHINTLHHPSPTVRPVTKNTRVEDVCVTFRPGSSHFFVGSSKEKETPKAQPRKRVSRHPQERKPHVDVFNPLNCGPGGPSTGPIHRRNFLDHALHNRIAEQELSEHATALSVLSFYRSTGQKHTQSRGPSQGYTYPSEAPMPPSADDALLMLHRPPPPWAALEATTSDIPFAKRPSAQSVVISDRKRAAMAEYVEQVNTKRRRIQETRSSEAAQQPTRPPETVRLSRNPFRRKISTQEVQQEMLSPTSEASLASGSTGPSSSSLAARGDLGQPNLMCTPFATSSQIENDKPPAQSKKVARPGFDWNGWGKK